MPRLTLLIALLLAAAGGAAAPADAFHVLLDDAWQWRLEENPTFASRLGDRRYNDRWRDLRPAAFARRQQARRAFLERLHAIDSAALSDDDRLNYDLFRRELEDDIERHRYRGWLMPVSQRGGVQALENVAQSIPLTTVADFEDWLARMAGVPEVLEQTTELLETGRRSDMLRPAVLMERIPAQLDAQLTENADESPFFAAFRDLPDGIPEADAERLRQRALAIIDGAILPAYREFRRYFEGRYLPAARDSIAVSELPDGKAYYEYLARSYTTTNLTPDEIHRIGLEEVKRIRVEMQAVIDETGFDGSFEEFLEFLRSDPQFYYDDPDDLFEAYLATCKRIDPELVKLFGKLPRTPYGLRAIPANIAPDTTTAYYSRPAADGSRAGYYYVNLYRPEVRPRYEIEVLSVHEAVPGHHLQIALQMELGELPAFRRYSGFTAFIEGWGLYSERLGYELGLYDDPYSHFGALTYDMWRAVRLVVDTGMHYKGWSREQAIGFFTDNAAKTEADIVNEIDRYIANPGQALAYKIGQLRMLEIREHAETLLGDRFDIRAFHDALLGGGALPLDLLELRMERWLAAQL